MSGQPVGSRPWIDEIVRIIGEQIKAAASDPNTAQATIKDNPSSVIDGFKVEMRSDALVAHLRVKADYHTQRADAYEEQANNLKTLQESDGGPVSYSNSPSTSLTQSADNHRRKATFYYFLMNHVVLNRTYRLGRADLDYIGVDQTSHF